jgi:stalled ribosome alternative rescue factor ArfA
MIGSIEISSRREKTMAKTSKKTLATRNPMAGSLSGGQFQRRVVRARKGKGSYSRKDKHAARAYA